MQEDWQFLDGSSVLDKNNLQSSGIPFSSQQDQNDSNQDLKEFKTCFKPLEMLKQIQEKSKNFDFSKDKDVVFILGSTGSGKSTTINFLLKKKIINKKVLNILKIDDVEIESLEENICLENEDENDEFKIGFKKESETLILKAKQMESSNLLICDTPGFQDSRGFEVDLSNSICLTNFIQLCRSICPILIINHHQLIAFRGQSFKNLLFQFSKFISIDCMDKILCFYTHVPEDVNIKSIISQITQIQDSLKQNSSPELNTLISELLKSFEKGRAFILNPLKQQPETYLELIKQQYENQQFINDPKEKFKINLSEDIETKLKIYSEDLLSYVAECTQKGFQIELAIDNLNNYLEIQNTLNLQILKDQYNKCIMYVEKYTSDTKKIAFQNLNESKNLLSEINERFINQIKICLQQMEKIDRFKNPHFSKYELSVNQIINELKEVIMEISQNIETNLNNQIESLDIKQMKYDLIKIEQLSQLSPDLEIFNIQILQFVNEKFYSYKNDQRLFLLDCLTIKKEKAIFNEKLLQIVKVFKFYQEIDSEINQLNICRDSLFTYLKQNLIVTLEDQYEQLTQTINKFMKQFQGHRIPSEIDLDLMKEQDIVFQIFVLQELSSNQFMNENIEQFQIKYSSAKQEIQELLKTILSYLKDNCEKKKYLREYELLIDKLNFILNIDFSLKQYFKNDYDQLIQIISFKIKSLKASIKSEIKYISNYESLRLESAQYLINLNKMVQKIKKYSEFLKNVTWIDEKFKIKCVQEICTSMKKSLQKYFDFWIEMCEQSINKLDFQKVDSFMIYLASLEDILDKFEDKIKNCIKKMNLQITLIFQSKKDKITNVLNSKNLYCKNKLKLIDESLEFKSKIEKMQNKFIKGFTNYDQEIFLKIENYFNEIYSEFKCQFNEFSFDKLQKMIENKEKGLSYWKNFIEIMNFCSKECHQIMNLLKLDSFKQIIQQVTNAFNTLIYSYKQTISDKIFYNQDYFQKVSNQYNLLEKFPQYFSNLDSTSSMRNELIKIQSLKQIVGECIQNLQKALQQNNFKEVKIYIDSLRPLTDYNSQKVLQNSIQELKQQKTELITDLLDQIKNNIYNNQQYIKSLENLKVISDILMEKFDQDLENIVDQFIKEQKKKIIRSVKHHQFYEVFLQFSFTQQFFRSLNKLEPEFFSENFILLEDQIKEEIQNIGQISPQNLLLKLNEKLYQAIKQAAKDDMLIKFFKEEIQLNLYRFIDYISQNLQQQPEKINLNEIKKLIKELSEQISLQKDILESNFEIESQQLVNQVESLQKQIKNDDDMDQEEMIEINLENLLKDFKEQFLIVNKKKREQQVQQIIKQIENSNQFQNKKLENQLNIVYRDLENILSTFFNKPQQEFNIEQFDDLIIYYDFIKILNTFPNKKNQFEKTFNEEMNKYINFMLEIEWHQNQLIKESNNMTNISKLVELYKFTQKYLSFITLDTKQIEYFQVNHLQIDLTFFNLENIEEAMKNYFSTIKKQIKINVQENKFTELKENLLILFQNIELNSKFKLDLFNFNQELQDIKNEIENIISLVKKLIKEYNRDYNTFLLINTLNKFQEQMSFFEQLDINQQLKEIKIELLYFIQHLVYQYCMNEDTTDTKKMFKKIFSQFPKLKGYIKNKISNLIHKTIKKLKII